MSDTPIIVCAADNRYAMPLATMLRSLVDNLRKYPAVQVWVMDGGVSWRNKRRVAQSLPKGRVDLHWIQPSHKRLKKAPVFGHVSICTYYRLVMGELLPPSIRKVIYLDVDTLVLGDIGELWDVELNTNTVAAVPHMGMKVSDPYGLAMYKELDLAPDTPYFNAGVLLIDLAQWRERGVGSLAFEFVGKYGAQLRFWDQDVLNGVLARTWCPLDAKWNVCVSHLWRSDAEEVAGDAKKMSVVHFASSIKPWNYGVGHPAEALFYRWMDQTVWAGWRPVRPKVDWKGVKKNLANKHWYGQCIRGIPGVGHLWDVLMRWYKR